jgi:hypothetical protein
VAWRIAEQCGQLQACLDKIVVFCRFEGLDYSAKSFDATLPDEFSAIKVVMRLVGRVGSGRRQEIVDAASSAASECQVR